MLRRLASSGNLRSPRTARSASADDVRLQIPTLVGGVQLGGEERRSDQDGGGGSESGCMHGAQVHAQHAETEAALAARKLEVAELRLEHAKQETGGKSRRIQSGSSPKPPPREGSGVPNTEPHENLQTSAAHSPHMEAGAVSEVKLAAKNAEIAALRLRVQQLERLHANAADQHPATSPQMNSGAPHSSLGDEWTMAGWIASQPVSDALTAALPASGRSLDWLREHGRRADGRDELLAMLRDGDALTKISDVLWAAIQELGRSRGVAAAAEELPTRFVQQDEGFELAYGDLSLFFGGLEAIVGAPDPKVIVAMEREHCDAQDSELPFSTDNYLVRTTSRIEWYFVVDPVQGIAQLGIEGYPREDPTTIRGSARPREPLPLAAFDTKLRSINDQLVVLSQPTLDREELIASRLYTGPLFAKYNLVLRGLQLDFAKIQLEKLCCGNHYTTTLHALNSSIVKLSKLTIAQPVYRGVAGARLPESFRQPNQFNVRGGIDCAFMSTTRDRQVAVHYARKAPGSAAVVFAMQQGMVNRGADVSWLSQYPHEAEILFAPLTGLEVQYLAIEGEILVAHVNVSINLAASTLEMVIGRRLKMLRNWAENMAYEVRTALLGTGFEDICVRALRSELQHRVLLNAAESYNDDARFQASLDRMIATKRNMLERPEERLFMIQQHIGVSGVVAVLEPITRILESSDADDRRGALRALSSFAMPAWCAAAVASLLDRATEKQERLHALSTLSGLDSTTFSAVSVAIVNLISDVPDDSTSDDAYECIQEVRSRALDVLGQHKRELATYREAVVQLLNETGSRAFELREKALELLATLSSSDLAICVPKIAESLDDESVRVRLAAFNLLQCIDSALLTTHATSIAASIIRNLQYPRESVRVAAVSVLGKLEPSAFKQYAQPVAKLLDLKLRDPNFWNRCWALDTVGRFKPAALATHASRIEQAARKDQHGLVRLVALQTLEKLDPSHLTAHAPLFVRKLADADFMVRVVALEALGRLEPTIFIKHISPIVGLLNDPNSPVRQATIMALGKHAIALQMHLDAVQGMLDDSECAVRRAAVEALRVLAPEALLSLAPLLLEKLEDSEFSNSIHVSGINEACNGVYRLSSRRAEFKLGLITWPPPGISGLCYEHEGGAVIYRNDSSWFFNPSGTIRDEDEDNYQNYSPDLFKGTWHSMNQGTSDENSEDQGSALSKLKGRWKRVQQRTLESLFQPKARWSSAAAHVDASTNCGGVSQAAAETLAKLEPSGLALHAMTIINKLDHPKSSVRSAAMLLIERLEPADLALHAATFIAKLESSEADIRVSAADCLKKLLPVLTSINDVCPATGATHGTNLAQKLEHPDASVRLGVLDVLMANASVLAAMASSIARRLIDGDEAVRLRAIRALAELEPALFASHAAAITKKLADEKESVRNLAIQVLDSKTLEANARSIVQMLNHFDVGVQISALRALGRLAPAVLAASLTVDVALDATLEPTLSHVQPTLGLAIEGQASPGAEIFKWCGTYCIMGGRLVNGRNIWRHTTNDFCIAYYEPDWMVQDMGTIGSNSGVAAIAGAESVSPDMSSATWRVIVNDQWTKVELRCTGCTPPPISVQAMLESRDNAVRQAAVMTLQKLEPSILAQHSGALLRMLQDSFADVRQVAIDTLNMLEPAVQASHQPANMEQRALSAPGGLRIKGGSLHGCAAQYYGTYRIEGGKMVNGQPVWRHTTNMNLWIAYSSPFWLGQTQDVLGSNRGTLALKDSGCLSPDLSSAIWESWQPSWQPSNSGSSWEKQPALLCEAWMPPVATWVMMSSAATPGDHDTQAVATRLVGLYGLVEGRLVNGRATWQHSEDASCCITFDGHGSWWCQREGSQSDAVHLLDSCSSPDLSTRAWKTMLGQAALLCVYTASPPPSELVLHAGVLDAGEHTIWEGRYQLASDLINGRPAWQQIADSNRWIAFQGSDWNCQLTQQLGSNRATLYLRDSASPLPNLSSATWKLYSDGEWTDLPLLRCIGMSAHVGKTHIDFERPLPASTAEEGNSSVAAQPYDALQCLFAFGGMNTTSVLSSAERYDPVTEMWTPVASMGMTCCNFGVAALSGKVVVVGGSSHEDASLPQPSMSIYNPLDDSWKTGVPMHVARTHLAAVAIGGHLFVVGGFNGTHNPPILSSVERFDAATNEWGSLAALGTGRTAPGVAALGGAIYVVGGNSMSGRVRSAERYNPITNEWTPIASMQAIRSGPAVVALGGMLYACGGKDASGNHLSSVERYDPSLDRWSAVASMGAKRSSPGAAVLDGAIYVAVLLPHSNP